MQISFISDNETESTADKTVYCVCINTCPSARVTYFLENFFSSWHEG